MKIDLLLGNNTRRPLPDLVQSIRAGNTIAVVGSGLSQAAGGPSWEDILNHMVAEAQETGVGNVKALAETLEHIRHRAYLAAAELLEEAYGPQFGNAVVRSLQTRRELQVDPIAVGAAIRGESVASLFATLGELHPRAMIPTSSHRLLARLPFRAVITTNYDSLLEDALPEERSPRRVFTRSDPLVPKRIQDGKWLILKIHGDISHPEEIVLSASKYDEVMFSSLLQESVRALLKVSKVFWIGYGHQDPTLDRLMTEGRQVLGLEGGYALARREGPEVERRFRNGRITPIWIDSHDDIPRYLQSLSMAVETSKTVYEVVIDQGTNGPAEANVAGHKTAQALCDIAAESTVWRILRAPTRVQLETAPATLATLQNMLRSKDPELLFLLRKHEVTAFDGIRLHWERSNKDGARGLTLEPVAKDGYAILVLKGEFDTFYCPDLARGIHQLLEQGVNHIALDMRLVKFINSTALGAIIKSHKRARSDGGELVVSQASLIVRHWIATLGIDRFIPSFDTNDSAVAYLLDRLSTPAPWRDEALGAGNILAAFAEHSRVQLPDGRNHVIGRISNVDDRRVEFRCAGQRLGLSLGQLTSLFLLGTEVNLKFQVDLVKKGYFDLVGEVAEVHRTDDGIRVAATYTRIADSDRAALRQFAEDMAFLKQQLPRPNGTSPKDPATEPEV